MALIKLTNQRNVVTKEGYKEIESKILDAESYNHRFIEVTTNYNEDLKLLNINHIIAVIDEK